MNKTLVFLRIILVTTFLLFASTSCKNPQPTMQPPIAKKIPKKLEIHNDIRIDDYYWLNDRENPEVIAYLEAENAYTNAKTAHFEGFREVLFEEMKGRIKKDDSSVPFFREGYHYYSRFTEGMEYPFYCRRKGSMEAAEEIIMDVNKIAEGQDYCAVAGGMNVSTNQNLLAYSVDLVSRRIYTGYVKDLATEKNLSDVIPGISGNVVWANDNKTLFYSKKHPETLRSYQIYRHELGTDSKDDVLVFEEKDEIYSSFVVKSKSKGFLMIVSQSTLTTEIQYLDANNPTGNFRPIQPRTHKLEYKVSHFGGHFYILTNHEAQNFRLMRTPVTATGLENWEEVIPHRPEVLLEGIELFDQYMVLEERKDGQNLIQIRSWDGKENYSLPFRDPAYSAGIGYNPEFETTALRFNYESMTTPLSTYEVDMKTQKQTLLKEQEILGGFDKENYKSERLFAPASDGVQVPVSLVYHKDTKVGANTPVLLYGYGSYGFSMDPYFSPSRLSLLNRGFIFAIAHVRGGEDMGRSWYEDGKMLKKKNTFTDFIACGEHLVSKGYTSPAHLYAMGGSAGGLLMGAVVNMRPDLFHGAVASVPFVDVVTTMLDEDIPLTTGEYDEWGNPNEKVYYDYMKSYSPYDNIEAKAYPNLLITTGLHDSQVQYWEPAKWIAKLRTLHKGDNVLLMETNMDAGHGGASGRFEALKEVALEFGFLLDLEGIVE